MIVASAKADIQPGNCLPMSVIPTGTILHNIEMRPGKGRADGSLGGDRRPADGA